jgi:hypothetical protein
MAESNLTVKNFSYCLLGFTKGVIAPGLARPNGRTPAYPIFRVITEVFPKMANSCWKSVGVPVTINHFRFDAPQELGRFPQIVFQKNRIKKFRSFRSS